MSAIQRTRGIVRDIDFTRKRDSLADAVRKAEDAKRVVGAVAARQQSARPIGRLARSQGFGRTANPAGGPDIITFQGRPLEDSPAPPPLGSGVRGPDVDIDPRTRLQFQTDRANAALRHKQETAIEREDRIFRTASAAGGTEFSSAVDPTGQLQARAELDVAGGAGSLQEAQRIERELADINAQLGPARIRASEIFAKADRVVEDSFDAAPAQPAAAPPVVGTPAPATAGAPPSAGVIGQPPVQAQGPSADPTVAAQGDRIKREFLEQRAATLQTELDKAKAGPAFAAKTPGGRAMQSAAGDVPELQGFARRLEAAPDFAAKEKVWDTFNKARSEFLKTKSTREREENTARIAGEKDKRDFDEKVRQFEAKQKVAADAAAAAKAEDDKGAAVAAAQTGLKNINEQLAVVEGRIKNATLDAQKTVVVKDAKGNDVAILTPSAKAAAANLKVWQAEKTRLAKLKEAATNAVADAQRGTTAEPTAPPVGAAVTAQPGTSIETAIPRPANDADLENEKFYIDAGGKIGQYDKAQGGFRIVRSGI